jgi:manganese/iron transport system permease protein
MLATAVAVASACAFLGVYLSFFIDSAPAPTIVVVMTLAFAAAFARSRLVSIRAAAR